MKKLIYILLFLPGLIQAQLIGVIAASGTSSIDYSIGSATYDTNSFDPSAQTGTGLLKLDIVGSHLYVNTSATVYRFSYTDTNISASSYQTDSYSTSINDGIQVSDDGFDLIGVASSVTDIKSRVFSTAFTLSTLGVNTSTSISAQVTTIRGVLVTNNGTKLLVADAATNTIYQFTLSTAWDGTTASYDSVSFSYAGQTTNLKAICISPDEKKLLIGDPATNLVYQFSLPTAGTLPGASYDSVTLDINGTSTVINDIRYNLAGTKLMVLDASTDKIYQYSLNN